ncbi:MAG: response regulator [Methyloversatilis sp.]|nr:response regulator [Methyloversatilis sp.]MBP6194462.1 response regulator [Methyloversatilis sp.]MBP9117331.1 response regulator [Methyloversatilis sp.]
MTATQAVLLPRNLLQRIRALFTLVFIIGMAGNAFYTAHEQSTETLRQLESNALAETRIISARLEPSATLADDPDKALLAHAPATMQLVSAALVSREGIVLSSLDRTSRNVWQTANTDAGGLAAIKVPADLHAEVKTLSQTASTPDANGRRVIVSWVPVFGPEAVVWLRTEKDTQAADEVWQHILSDSLLHGLISMLVAIVSLHMLLRRPLAGLQQCTEFAERLDHSMGNTLPPGTGSLETDRLTAALNWASLSLYDQRSALIESEARTGTILSAAIDGVITFDCFGNVIEFNPAAAHMLGWTTAEAMQRPVIELLVAPEERDPGQADLLQWLGQRFDTVIGHQLEIEITRRDGMHFPAELAITSTQMKGRALFTAFVSDISERKAAQEQMMQARDAAETANRAKSDFLANMSHEIRTPMNAIIGMTELALDTELTEVQREYLGLVQQSSETLLTLIDDILDFSKIEAGHLDFEQIPFSMRDVVDSVVRTLKPKPGKPVALTCRVDPNVADSVIGDPTRLRQILVNLVSNALKFTECGTVEISVSQEEQCPEAQTLRFAIRDTGIGIPSDKQTLIFDAFSQADTSTTRKFGGTGLGLAICRRLVQRMEGTIGVTSQPGVGSTFHFTARLRRTDSGTLGNLAADTLEGLPVLVIDPDPESRRQLAAQLAQWHTSPRFCERLDEGIEAILSADEEGRRFRALLVDFSLAAQDNWALVQMFSGEHASALPVIVLSDRECDLPDGASGVVSRPAEASALLTVLITAVGANDSPRMQTPRRRAPDAPDQGALRVLLAEDNPVNQTLAVRMLERMGHEVDVAGNGLEAVEMAAGKRFDVILMDIQMPQMGGFDATQHIRAQDGQRHTPIIAMTAHAMAGDRERCFAAGMDGYVSKPIRVPELLRALGESQQKQGAVPATGTLRATPEGSRFDRPFMLGNLEADEELMREIMRIFLRDYQAGLDGLSDALKHADRVEVSARAHALRGMVRNFGATRAAGLAAQLERRNGPDMTGPELLTLFSELSGEIQALADELRAEQKIALQVA